MLGNPSQVCTYSDVDKIVRVRVVNSIVRAVMRKGILTRASVEEFGDYLLRRRLPAPSFFNDHDCLEQLIAALVADLCAYRDNAKSGPLLCMFWIGLQEFAYRTFRAWETVAARETRAEHWLRMLHAYAADRKGWMQVEGIVRTVLDCAKLEQVRWCGKVMNLEAKQCIKS